MRKKVLGGKSELKSKFGDGKTVESAKTVKIPEQIGNKEIDILTYMIDDELVLLKGHKKEEKKVDFIRDKIYIAGQERHEIYNQWQLFDTSK